MQLDNQVNKPARSIRSTATLLPDEDLPAIPLAQFDKILITAYSPVQDIVVVLDEQGSICIANLEAQLTYGYTEDTLAGKFVRDIYAPASWEQQGDGELHEMLTQDTTFIKTKHRRYDGTAIPVEVRTRLLVMPAGRRIVMVVCDLSRQRHHEAAQSQDRDLLQALLANITDNVYFKDTECRFLRVSRQMAHLFSIKDPSKAIGKTDFDFFTPEHARKAYDDEMRIMHTGQPLVDIEERETWANRDDSWVSTTKMPLRDSEGNIIGTFGISRDITARKRAEIALAQTADELARSNAELQQFAYVASHDLQEPLRMVASYVQLLARRYKGQLDQDADEFIDYAVDGANRMKMLINDLLAYSRVGTHGKPFLPVECKVIVNRALDNLQIAIEDNRAVVTVGALPIVMGDDVQLVQLFQNIVGNALKFHGEAPPEIRISAEREDDFWVISIQDNGIGIDLQYVDRIFTMFQRLHTREEYPGTGIGLAVCKKIVERHQGRIWVESTPAIGATFKFTLPYLS